MVVIFFIYRIQTLQNRGENIKTLKILRVMDWGNFDFEKSEKINYLSIDNFITYHWERITYHLYPG